ncbi:molybdopterin-dependent oxidoreductase [Clostridioides difficile]|uniref:molybdopterin-dependent oxidoreductase n=1 Tax=Clostridioides difficile TaxID=1496 RepID=UPI00038DBC08|nr:molybdopterin-dependent oxidoreductase [Clostridioides difficile]EQE64912.1 molybdopterin dinucleotide binding domain protein [Clostridioides difficile CD46]EQJ51791.1 molybdopterin dinucleotide binding domain protein [Clostridioides difficile P24]EQJ62341.1 molybdopterin dinucleotide binding domain protein [Clostridioides difficile P32]MBH7287009.1 molybdopterin-dependent oxidoreductase [Clostridioides difficile]MBH7400566.1 molybdopterin-dependent oxidoreductase [Clostridioides difficile]
MDIIKKLSHGCTLDCHDCCKFNVYTKGNNVVKIEGDKNHPYTKGFICKKGMAHLDRLNHKDRIKTPMLKVDGVWKEISFDKAIEIMAEKLTYYKEKYTSKSVMHYDQYGSGSVLKYIGDIFFNFYGGVIRHKGGPCWSAGMHAQKYDFGVAKSHAIEDMLNSKSIFVWGKNPAYTTIHTMQIIKKAKEKGIKIVVIDPIYTKTAQIADKYVQVNPGTDGALAIAMAKIIVEDKLYDEEYINSYVIGFEEYKKYLSSLELSFLIDECGVKENDIRELVDLYTNKYSSINVGYGLQKYKNGGNTIRAIDALGAITGQIGFSGGGINYANKVYPSVINSDPYNSQSYGEDREFYVSNISKFIEESLKNTSNKVNYISDELDTTSNKVNYILDELDTTSNKVNCVSDELDMTSNKVNYVSDELDMTSNKVNYVSDELDITSNKTDYISNELYNLSNKSIKGNIPIKMAVITKSNMLNQLPDLVELERVFSKIEFKVCFDMFITDTATLCDMFIPCTNTLESEDIIYSSMTNPYITYNERAVKPAHKLMDEYYFFMELAKKMGLNDYPFVEKRTYLEKVIEPLKRFDKNLDIEKLKNNYFTIHNPVAWEDKKFETPSGKYELYSESIKNLGISPTPVYISNKYKEIEDKNISFRLLTNHHADTLFSQHFMDKKSIAQAYINRRMAKKVGIEDKDIVILRSKKAKINVQINIDDGVGNYIVKMYVGWWKKHGNPNSLTDTGISDFGGQVTYNESMVEIIRQN